MLAISLSYFFYLLALSEVSNRTTLVGFLVYAAYPSSNLDLTYIYGIYLFSH